MGSSKWLVVLALSATVASAGGPKKRPASTPKIQWAGELPKPQVSHWWCPIHGDVEAYRWGSGTYMTLSFSVPGEPEFCRISRPICVKCLAEAALRLPSMVPLDEPARQVRDGE